MTDLLDTRDLADELADEDTDHDRAHWIKTLFDDFGIDPDSPDDYDVVIVADTYFVEYAQQLAEDCGLIDQSAQWPNYCIDWKRAARELQYDYAATTIDGETWWFRA